MERIQKLIAKNTELSRRSVEKAIKEKRVLLNNRIAILGDKADVKDNISIDGNKLNLNKYTDSIRVLMMNKKTGMVCSKKDEKNRPTVFSLLPKDNNWIMVGRLDINTSGLLLFTNSGELANGLMHPSSNIDREYLIRILGKVENHHLSKLSQGIKIDNYTARFKKIEFAGGNGANTWYKVVIGEGKKREVRKMWESLGFQVSRLVRTRFYDVLLPKNLKAGEIIELKPKQVTNLQKLIN